MHCDERGKASAFARGEFWLACISTTGTVSIWVTILFLSLRRTKLRFVQFMSCLMLMSQFVYLVGTVSQSVIDFNKCEDPEYTNPTLEETSNASSIIFYMTYDGALWLYAAKYWLTSKSLQAFVNKTEVNYKLVNLVWWTGLTINVAWPLVYLATAQEFDPYFFAAIIVARLIAFFILLRAMLTIKKVLAVISLNLVNIRMMSLHVVAFAGFIVASVPYDIGLIALGRDSDQRAGLRMWSLPFFVLTNFISQSMLAVALKSIINKETLLRSRDNTCSSSIDFCSGELPPVAGSRQSVKTLEMEEHN